MVALHVIPSGRDADDTSRSPPGRAPGTTWSSSAPRGCQARSGADVLRRLAESPLRTTRSTGMWSSTGCTSVGLGWSPTRLLAEPTASSPLWSAGWLRQTSTAPTTPVPCTWWSRSALVGHLPQVLATTRRR
ncbi:MAG: hypothetical protein R2695_03440 [Acidimicrobiales bacterium]